MYIYCLFYVIISFILVQEVDEKKLHSMLEFERLINYFVVSSFRVLVEKCDSIVLVKYKTNRRLVILCYEICLVQYSHLICLICSTLLYY